MAEHRAVAAVGSGVSFALAGLVIFALIGFASGQSSSSQESQEAWADMPTYNIFSDEEMKRDFVRMEFKKPADRADLGFLLAVPKTWEEQPLTVSAEELANDDQEMISLALMGGPEKDVQIEIAYCRVSPSIDLEQWARAYLDGNSLGIIHWQTGDFSGRQVFDTLLQAPGGYKVRLTFSLHGDKVFIVSGSSPEARYEAYMRVFGLAVVSFQKL